MSPQEMDRVAIETFQEYLRIPSVHPNVNYDECVAFLQKQAQSMDLPCKIVYTKPTKPVVIITWIGSNPNLPSIMLNSHMDVVPVFEDKWTKAPFGGEVHEGKIYGRGAQDMKGTAVQYLEAMRRLKADGVRLMRTLHCTFVPDEEIGGEDGMGAFVKMEEFEELRVGVSFDEGIASDDESFVLFNGERCKWDLIFHCPGQPGHASLLLENTATEKALVLLNKIYQFRDTQKSRLLKKPNLKIGDVISVNVTMINGGVLSNVLPDEISLRMDCRLSIDTDAATLYETMEGWCAAAGRDVRIEKVYFDHNTPPTRLDDSNVYWKAFKRTMDRLKYKVHPQIDCGITDGRFVRRAGIPVLGFSPMNRTPMLLHDNDEYLDVEVFLKGIDIYCELLKEVGNIVEN